MTLDINKIINESIQASQDTSPEILTENEDVDTISETHHPMEQFSEIVESSLAAGLGALMLRKKLRSLQELDLGDVGEAIGKSIRKFGKAASEQVGTAGKYLGKAVGQVGKGDFGDAADYAKKAIKKAPGAVAAGAAGLTGAGYGVYKGIKKLLPGQQQEQ